MRNAKSRERDPGVDLLWRSYRRSRDLALRNRLAEHYLAWARSIADRVARRLPRHADPDELASDGAMGLLWAIERYDPARGPRFEAFARRRIEGAIVDQIRGRDFVSRKMRERSTRLNRAAERLARRGIFHPTEREIAGELGLAAGEARTLMRQALAARRRRSLTALHTETDSGRIVTIGQLIADGRAREPWELADRSEFWERVTRGLEPRQRAAVILYWREDLTLREVGRAMGLSEARVSQIVRQAVRIMRSRMTAAKSRFEPLSSVGLLPREHSSATGSRGRP